MGDEEKKRCCEGWVGQYMFSPNRKRGGGVSMKNNNTPLHSHNTPTLSFHPPPPSEHAASGHPNAVGPIHASQTKHKRDGTLGDTDHDDRHALRGGVSTVSARPPSPPPHCNAAPCPLWIITLACLLPLFLPNVWSLFPLHHLAIIIPFQGYRPSCPQSTPSSKSHTYVYTLVPLLNYSGTMACQLVPKGHVPCLLLDDWVVSSLAVDCNWSL